MLGSFFLSPVISPFLSEEVCILSASGTAAILNPRYMREGCLDIGSTDHRFFYV